MQNTMDVQWTALRQGAAAPDYATAGAAGADLRACLDAPLTLHPGDRALVPTGISLALPHSGLAAFLFARSGLAVRDGVALSNGVGVIDSDYRGEIQVGLINLSDKPHSIHTGDRIAQLVVMPVEQAVFRQCAELPDTARGTGGFGSTGK